MVVLISAVFWSVASAKQKTGFAVVDSHPGDWRISPWAGFRMQGVAGALSKRRTPQWTASWRNCSNPRRRAIRKARAVLGYGLGASFGKGIGGALRDALVADLAPPLIQVFDRP